MSRRDRRRCAVLMRKVHDDAAGVVEIRISTAQPFLPTSTRGSPPRNGHRVVDAYIARGGRWRLRTLLGVVTAPTPPGAALPRPPLISIEETRRQLGGAARSNVYKLLAARKIRSVKVGRRRFIVAASIEELIRRHAR